MIRFEAKDTVHGLLGGRCAMASVTAPCRGEILFHPMLWESHYNKLPAVANMCFQVSAKR